MVDTREPVALSSRSIGFFKRNNGKLPPPPQSNRQREPSPSSTAILINMSSNICSDKEPPPDDPTAAHLLALTHSFIATVNMRQHRSSSLAHQGDDAIFSYLNSHLARNMHIEHRDVGAYDESNLLRHFGGKVLNDQQHWAEELI